MRDPLTTPRRESQPDGSPVEGPILVVGVPRSGTTWVSKVLALGYGAQFINEPDSEIQDPFALKAKLDLGRFPVLARDELAPFAYAELWDRAFEGFRRRRSLRTALARRLIRRGRKSGELASVQCLRKRPGPTLKAAAALAEAPSERSGSEHLVIKTVHAPLAIEWVHARKSPRIVVVTRHPLNVVASWLDLGYRSCRLYTNPAVSSRFGGMWNLRPPPETDSELTRVVWEIGLFMSALRVALERHPDWIETSHDELCLDLNGGFQRLFGRLGLQWSSEVDNFIGRSNRPGSDPFSTDRVALDQPARWRRSLSDHQVEQITGVLRQFPPLRFDAASSC